MKKYYDELVESLKLRYYAIFHYASKNIVYLLFKTLCIPLFIIPFAIVSSIVFVADLILFVPSKIPIIRAIAKLICKFFDFVTWILFSLVILADRLFQTNLYQMTKIDSNKNQTDE